MKYIKLFSNHTDYESEEQNLVFPNISYCKQESEVHFNPDPYNGHKFVDLGLPSGTLWATTNIGAATETDYGQYFAWGETQGYAASQVGTDKRFSWTDYKFNPSGDGRTMTKYNSTDGLSVLELEDDAAYVNWGEMWCMPKETQFDELTANTINKWVTDYKGSGINGRLFAKTGDTGYAGTTLFFPAAGGCYDGDVSDVSNWGDYWSRSRNLPNVIYGERFHVKNNDNFVDLQERSIGLSIRPIVYFAPLN